MRLLSYIVSLAVIFGLNVFAAATYTSGSTAAQLAAQIQGPGLKITNPVLRVGKSSQAGTFSNGVAGAGLEVDQGIVLTTMDVATAFQSNISTRTSKSNSGSATDSDLTKIDSRAIYDTVVFEFDVTLDSNTRLLMVDYQFASEEYNEWVGSRFNDAFGFFVSGGDLTQTYNIARVVDDSTIVTTANISKYDTVTVNNVNRGSVGTQSDGNPVILTNSKYFIDNCYLPSKYQDAYYDCKQSKAKVTTEFDGLTHRLHATLDNLTPGKTYHFKMAIADTSDAQWDTGVFVNKITGIRAPQFCYDYAYKQNNRYITDKSFLGQTPQISSYVQTDSDLEMGIYLKNVETSELTAKGLKMSINDINTTQATYSPGTVQLMTSDKIAPSPIADNTNGMSNAPGYIHYVPVGDLGSEEYYYLYYNLKPKINDLNMSLDANVSFYLTVQGVNIPYDMELGSDKIPMCATTSTYAPQYGIYNVVESELYPFTDGHKYYNLRTQVAKRAGNFKVVSYDPANVNTEKTVSTIAAVDLVDVKGYFDTNTTCRDPQSAISPRIWVKFTAANQVSLNKAAIQAAITAKLTTLTSPAEFYAQARENTAFRVAYMVTNDGNQSLVQTSPGTPANKNTKIDNFTELVQDIHTCKQPVQINLNTSNTTEEVSVACGNAGNQGLEDWELKRCFECLYGYNTHYICSRDNFAIRPEALTVQMYDVNQTDTTQVSKLPTITGLTTAPSPSMNLAAGYNYRFDMNATNFIDNTATEGYTQDFGRVNTDKNATMRWVSVGNDANCSDTDDTMLTFAISDGQMTNQIRKHDQIGLYKLHIQDREWTKVDHTDLTHHTNNSYFKTGIDCTDSIDTVLAEGTDSGNGCLVDTGNMTSPSNRIYQDHNLTFLPYRFDMDGIVFGVGTTPSEVNTSVSTQYYVYTANMNRDDSMNMSLRGTGLIKAVGYDNVVMSNFVGGCYAKNLNFNLLTDNNATLDSITPYRVRYRDYNATAVVMDENLIYDSNGTVINTTTTTVPLLIIDNTHFKKNVAGMLMTQTRLNYDHNFTNPTAPKENAFAGLNLLCSAGDCLMYADLVNNHEAVGERAMDFNVTHLYGRFIPRDVRVFGNIDFEANGWYEVYMAPTVNGLSLVPSRFTPSWYINSLHSDTNDGDAIVTELQQVGGTTTSTAIGTTVLNGVETFRFGKVGESNIPYTRKAHVDTTPWLWYGVNVLDYLDPSLANLNCQTHPCFNITVSPAVGRAGSATTEELKSDKSNKGTDTEDTIIYDYSPSTR